MTIEEAIRLGQKVLEEERNSPTVRYMLREPVASAAAPAAIALSEKGRHPRTVWERPGIHRFTSDNYELPQNGALRTPSGSRFLGRLDR